MSSEQAIMTSEQRRQEAEERNLQATLKGWVNFNAHDASGFVAGVTPDYQWFTDTLPGGKIEGAENAQAALEGFFKAFSDIRFTVDQAIAKDNFTVVRFTSQGTRTNGFMGLPPTDLPFVYHGLAFNRFLENGKRAESWIGWDRAYVLQQLGVLPETFGRSPRTEGGRVVSPAVTDPGVQGEEVLIRYGAGNGYILEDPRYIILRIDTFTPDGQPGGSYEGIQAAVGAATPQQLMTKPPMPSMPIDQPGGIPQLPIGGYYKSTWKFNDEDSITAIGASQAFLAPLADGSMIFMTTAMGIITGGTGRYEGASGVKSAVGSGQLAPGAPFGPNTVFPAKTFDVFRVVRKPNQAPIPQGPPAAAAGGPSSPGGAPSPPTVVSAPAGPPATAAAAGMPPGPPPGMPPLPPTFPPGVNPETYKLPVVQHLLRRAAYFSFFSMPNSAEPNVPIIANGQMIGVHVHENLHRFDVRMARPTAERGLRAANVVGLPAAKVHIIWRPIPDDYVANPNGDPPPTPLDPTRSQRFTFLDGEFRFDDASHSGFHGFGTGRTFPVRINGQPQLRIGAVIDILEGYGKLKNHQGTVVVNGYITPPSGLALNIMLRVLDPSGDLLTTSDLPALVPIPDPDPGTTFLTFLGEENDDEPTTTISGPGGQMQGASVHELLRLVHLDSAATGRRAPLAKTSVGTLVGRLDGQLLFNPFAPGLQPPIPFQTRNGVFQFFDGHGGTIGTLTADIVEGRAFPAQLPGAPMPVFRFGGFGPFISGTGQLSGAVGMMSLNAAISVFPRTLSNLYVLRVSDPDGRFGDALASAWC